jgi:hypothetical protein
MSRTWIWAALALAAALGTGCSQQEPAQKAVDAAEQALASVSDEALKYIPQQYGELKTQLDAARKALDEQKYAEAIKAAEGLPARAQALGAAAAAARETLAAELKVDWERLKGTMPARLAALEDRVTELSKAKRLPGGVDRGAVDRARSGFEIAKQAWADSNVAYDQGNLEGAVARGQESDRLIAELMEEIGMAPAAAGKPAG